MGNGRLALPGVDEVTLAGPMQLGLAASFTTGYGYTEAIIESADQHHRVITSLSFSYRPKDWLAVGLNLDGRYDRHRKLSTGRDDSFVLDPRLFGLATYALSETFAVGALVTVWTPPGKKSFSFVGRAVTPELRLLASYRLNSGPLLLAANAGFRLDRSASAIDSPEQYSSADQLALGLSGSNVVPLGFAATYDVGSFSILSEWAWDLHVGESAPRPRSSPMALSFGGRYAPATMPLAFQVIMTTDVSLRPDFNAHTTTIPIEPRWRITAGISFSTRAASDADVIERIPTSPAPTPPAPPTLGKLNGRVVTGADQPIRDAVIKLVTNDGHTLTATTTLDGRFTFDEVPLGDIRVKAEARGYVAAEETTRIADATETKDLTLRLAEALPEGEIRGTIRTFRGQGLPASLTIEPLAKSLTANADGTFAVIVPPGTYEITIQAKGYRSQTRQLTVETEGVTVLNVDLRRR